MKIGGIIWIAVKGLKLSCHTIRTCGAMLVVIYTHDGS